MKKAKWKNQCDKSKFKIFGFYIVIFHFDF